MFYLDLDELEEVCSSKWFLSKNRFNLVSFHRKDYFRPEVSCLKSAVIDACYESLNQQGSEYKPISSVRILTHLRLFNHVFNPVTFYYCFDENDQLVCILSEITNTPWNERHHYVLPVHDQKSHRYKTYAFQALGGDKFQFEFSKAFHVSPFNPMNMEYRWIFNDPSDSLNVHMENRLFKTDQGQNLESEIMDTPLEKHFDATLKMNALDIRQNLSSQLIRQPFMTVKVVIGIYWQAFKLWCKRSPFYDHPKLKESTFKPTGSESTETHS